MTYSAFNETWQVKLIKSKYGNGRLALRLEEVGDSREIITVITCNIPSTPLGEDEIIVKNYSENSGMDNWLVRNDIAVPTGRSVSSGFVIMPIMKLTARAKTILNV